MKTRLLSVRAKDSLSGYLFLLPSLILFSVFLFAPLVYGLVISFTDYGGFGLGFHFTGLANYRRLFSDDYFKVSMRNNLFYLVTFVPATVVLSTAAAIALNGVHVFRKFFRMAFYFPQVASMVSVAMVWCILFNPTTGPVNAVLTHLGVRNPPEWLMSQSWAMVAVVIVSVWKSVGFYMIILLAGLQGIPDYLYESAIIDGAGAWDRTRYITLPMLSPTVFMVTVLAVINSFQVFDLVSVMTNGGPGRATNVLVYRIYQEAFVNLNAGYASAMAAILFIIVFAITALQFGLEKKWVHY